LMISCRIKVRAGELTLVKLGAGKDGKRNA